MEPPKIEPKRIKIELIDESTSRLLRNFTEIRNLLDETDEKMRNKVKELRFVGFTLSYLDKSEVPDYFRSLADEFSKKAIEYSDKLLDIASEIRMLERKIHDDINILSSHKKSAIEKFVKSI